MVSRVLSMSVGAPEALKAASGGPGPLGRQGLSPRTAAALTAVTSPQAHRVCGASEFSALGSLSRHFL